MYEALIFDLDDLLTDTESLHLAAYQRVLGEIGVAVDDATYTRHWIMAGLGIADFCLERELKADPAVLRERKLAVYLELVAASAQAMPGAVELLRRVKGRARLAVATSSYRGSALGVLHAVKMMEEFECVVTGSDVARAKPAPDVLLLAAQRLGVAPEKCIVLDDADKGVRAAVAAGMPVIAVPSARTRGGDFGAATRVVGSLWEVTDEVLEEVGRVRSS